MISHSHSHSPIYTAPVRKVPIFNNIQGVYKKGLTVIPTLQNVSYRLQRV